MSLLALIMGAVLSGNTIIEYGKQPLDIYLVEQHTTPVIQHVGFASGDQRQAIIQKAYKLGGLDFVTMIECENGTWDMYRKSATNDHGICQLNYRYNKNFIDSDGFHDINQQLEYCYSKWTVNPRLWYGPDRKIKGIKCKEYVKDRFIIN